MVYTLLSLGDSYTIGEGVLLTETYAYQTVQSLRELGHRFTAPEIIARTGWTTDELAGAIAKVRLLPAYDFVSLLIGVNNQYRGRSCEEYGTQFETLLRQALVFAAEKTGHVFVLSIPDWGVSPFAADRDRSVIAQEIDAFNAMAKRLCEQHQVAFIDITPHSRNVDSTFAADGLHPSEEQYRFWARLLTEKIAQRLSGQ
ncbi:MAG: SGNH/GDSL hydrolase family protein [Chitinophagaceae bacterium]|nr:SGNH/GDSL hydrolase family protein [Chitinophagaceae bacterium]